MQQIGQNVKTTLNKGLITEASELTFPEDATTDELNCDIKKVGGRSRRLGVNFEEGYTLSSFSFTEGDLVENTVWNNVGGQAGVDYEVIQLGSTLYFYNKNTSTTLSDNEVSYTVDLTTFEHASSNGAETAPIQATSITGALLVVSPEINPFYIEYDVGGDSYTETTITPRIRDFQWQGDKTTYNVQGTPTVSDARQYDTYNSGWTSATITTYQATHASDFPPLTHRWYSGKDSAGAFNVADWEEVYGGNTVLEGGRFILDLFSRNRTTALNDLEGVSLTITTENETSRFRTVAGFSGRAWYAGLTDSFFSSTVFFSTIINDLTEVGDCYQRNDPTSEELSDLLDNDGGYVTIPEAYNIQKLHVLGSSMLVFAENGVWEIRGIDGYFTATEFEVRKITSVGLEHFGSFVSAEGTPFWWSSVGIHSLVAGDDGRLAERDISFSTIQSRWDNIGKKSFVKSAYDRLNKRLVWMYPNDDETVDYKVNQLLFLDLQLQAFYPWKVEDRVTGTNYLMGATFVKGQGLKYLSRSSSMSKLVFSDFAGVDFLDWGETNYSSYFETGYDFMEDVSRYKNAVYITVVQKVTETGWTGNEIAGYSPVRPSSLKINSYWDFNEVASSTQQECYRLGRMPLVDSNDLSTFSYPKDVISVRVKLRGRGQVVKFRFESSEGKDFYILGYEVIGARNPNF